LRWAAADIIAALSIATLVDGAILCLAGRVFHGLDHVVADVEDAYQLLAPPTGSAWVFGVALLASGQSATFTGTIAGQVVLEGFTDWRIPDWPGD
jgi:manganese transport protein